MLNNNTCLQVIQSERTILKSMLLGEGSELYMSQVSDLIKFTCQLQEFIFSHANIQMELLYKS